MCSTCVPRSSLPTDASLSSTGSSGASSPASTVLSKRYDFLPPIPPHFVTFVWRYLSVALVMFAPRWTSEPPKPGVGNPVSAAGISPRKRQDLASSWGIPIPVCLCSVDAGRTACTRPLSYSAATWPSVCEQRRLPRKVFRCSIAWLSDSLSTLRSADYSNPTQDSLPAAGQALPDGLSTRRIPMKGFRFASYISSPFPKLLGAITSPDVFSGSQDRGDECGCCDQIDGATLRFSALARGCHSALQSNSTVSVYSLCVSLSGASFFRAL